MGGGGSDASEPLTGFPAKGQLGCWGGRGDRGPRGRQAWGSVSRPVLPPRPWRKPGCPWRDLCASGKGRPQPPGPCRAPHFLPAPVWILPVCTSVEPGAIHGPAGGSRLRERLWGPQPHPQGKARRSGAKGPAPPTPGTCFWAYQGFPQATEGLSFNSRKSPKQLTDPQEV